MTYYYLSLRSGALPSQLLSAALLRAILADQLSDCFVNALVWERLGYGPGPDGSWHAGVHTPLTWQQVFPIAPDFIAQRPANVRLTRSIAKPHKQLLKQQLGFTGYVIGELYPRRTRRATVVNWLLAWLAAKGEPLPETGPLPPLLPPPKDPAQGHPGDPRVS